MSYTSAMWLISVTPISRGINKERLYYFTTEKFDEGDLVEIPVRSRDAVGRVDEIRAVVDAKAELKSLPFAIRKASTLKAEKFFSKPFMSATEKTARYFSTTLGATLHSLLPPKRLLGSLNSNFEDKGQPQTSAEPATYVLQCQDEDRLSAYRRLAREEFAQKRSIILLLPTVAEAIKTFKEIQKGVEDYAFLLHQRLPRANLSTNWQKAATLTHPIILVCTPQFMGLPRKDFGIVAIERESSKNYKRDSRPFMDFRVFAKFFAKELRAKLIYADSMIRAETYHKLDNGEAYEYNKASFRPLFPAETEIFLTDKKIGKDGRALDDKTRTFIEKSQKAGMRLFILSPRRGLAPRTICRNCGKGLTCENCGGALVLHGAIRKRSEDRSLFLCHRCGTEVDSSIRCPRCQGWDLLPFRVGTEQIENELKELFPDVSVIRFDKDSIKTDNQAAKAMQKFLTKPGSILIGTELVFSHLTEKIEAVLVVFPELLTSVPEYTGDENALRFMLRGKSLAQNKFAIQTAEPELPVIKFSENANLADFYRHETGLRKSLLYPPFSTLVLITYRKNEVIQKQIEQLFAAYEPTFFESMGDSKQERVFMRIENSKWPDQRFRELALSLPQSCAVEIMPERLFT